MVVAFNMQTLHAAVLGALLAVCAAQLNSLDLGQQAWVVFNETSNYTASVPGQVHIDLLNNNVIDDPYYRFNDINYQWIALGNWTYTATFTIAEQNLLSYDNVMLVCEGLDTVATVTVNNVPVLSSTNMFRTYRVDVKSLLTSTNTITVAFTSAVTYAAAQAAAYNSTLKAGIPPLCPDAVQNGFCHPNFIRKEPCSFSWDWGPAFAPSGIWRDIYLVGYSQPYMQDITVVTTPVAAPTGSQWIVDLNVYSNASRAGSSSVEIALYELSGALVNTTSVVAQFTAGENINAFSMAVDGVAAWWPNNYGSPTLYKLVVTIGAQSFELRIGFRTVKLVQEPVPGQTGLSYLFEINGVPIFIKGANWVPADSFEVRVTRDTLEGYFKSYQESNFNTLRNWGGGIYQQDAFYDLADEYGIMIWEEFIFACALYPTNTAFLSDVANEVLDNVKRTQFHPSLIVWSGNNENEASIAENWWGFPETDEPTYASMYSSLYFGTVFATVATIDTSRPVLASSPSNGDETAAAPIALNPQDTTVGDVHYYNYDADCWDPSTFPRPRFASEYGFESFPSLVTIAPISNQSAGDWDYNSAFLAHRQHHPDGNAQIQQQVELHYAWPPNNTANPTKTFGDTLFITQVMQAMCIKSESEHYRRSRDQTANGYCMGALYWQANDIWQAPSWASIEYQGRWKMLQYYSKRFFNPFLVSMWTIPGDQSLGLYIVSDLVTPTAGVVTIQLWPWAGTAPVVSWNISYSITGQNATEILTESIPQFLAKGNCTATTCFAFYSAYDSSNNLLSDNTHFFGSFADVALVNPNLSINQITKVDDFHFKITYSATNVAAFTWLETTVKGHFSDNGFLALPGTGVVVFKAEEDVTAAFLEGNLTIMSLYSLYN